MVEGHGPRGSDRRGGGGILRGAGVTVLLFLMAGSAMIAAGTLAMTLLNLRIYRRPPEVGKQEAADSTERIMVCIPARNEEANLCTCVESLLRSTGVEVTVLVYDDHSTDGTGAVLAALRAEDARVVEVPTVELPPGWNGKQHGCEQAGRLARSLWSRPPVGDAESREQEPWLLFTDADVRFEPGCLSAAARAGRVLGADLISTFPRQITGTVWEGLAVPMIHFILFSFLPMGRMRRTRDPAASAGCGQFLMVRAGAWAAAGGHAAFRASMHDGIRLPRAVRKAGGRTDLFDGTGLCSVRMYRGLGQTWRGFTKNAYEGLGSPVLLVVMTVMLALGHVLPPGVVLWAASTSEEAPSGALALVAVLAGVAWVFGIVQRGVLARRFALPAETIVLHPLGVLFVLAIQWWSFGLHLAGRRRWRGRVG
ncbi:MAG: glycosyltransferase [Phycisphaerales bacterium]